MLGAALLATFSSSHTINIFAETANAIGESPAGSSDVSLLDSESPDNTGADSIDDSDDDLKVPTIPGSPTDHFTFTSDLIIKAINPGYTVDGTQNVGEFIELQRTADTPLSLANYSVRYITSSGKSTTLLNFSEGSSLVGEFLLMRLARSPDSDQSDATYMTTLAMGAGTVELLYHEDVIDSVCWASKSETCSDSFKSADPTVLVRNSQDGMFEHLTTYVPNFNPEAPSLIVVPPEPPEAPDSSQSSDVSDETQDSSSPEGFEPPSDHCHGLEFSEILSYYTNDKSEQFIELYNPTDRNINLNSCTLRYKNKSYTLSGMIELNNYFALYPAKFSPSLVLTKNPSSSNRIDLVDADNSIVDTLVYSHGQKKSTSYAKFYDSTSTEIWELTYSITPGLENNYQEFRTCESGKVINPDTGNCVKVSTATDNNLTECPAGKYRNPLTGRCKNIEVASTELKPCAEGYERNPETNRCRKVVAENDGAGYALVPTTSSAKSTFIALGAVILIISLGIIYIILQFRYEIARAFRKIRQRLHHVR